MYTNNQRFISENETRGDYINLGLEIGSTKGNWKSAVEMFRNRICGRYFDQIEMLLNMDAVKNGFASMALCCLLIDTLMQFREGFEKTPEGQNKRYYIKFLEEQFPDVFEEKTAKAFYSDIRCGIMHSGQTKNGSCLTPDRDYVVKLLSDGILMVDVNNLYMIIRRYFEKYCEELLNRHDLMLCNHFIIKMDDITRRWEGNDAFDDV